MTTFDDREKAFETKFRTDEELRFKVAALRDQGKITLPTSVGEERRTNPFVLSSDTGEFARRRAEKDSFRS